VNQKNLKAIPNKKEKDRAQQNLKDIPNKKEKDRAQQKSEENHQKEMG